MESEPSQDTEEAGISTTPDAPPKAKKKKKSKKPVEPKEPKEPLPLVSLTDAGNIRLKVKSKPRLPSGALLPEKKTTQKKPQKSKILKQEVEVAGEREEYEEVKKRKGTEEQVCLDSWLGNCEDFVALVADEVALEGLDGITLEALWTRISTAMHLCLPLSYNLQKFAWDALKRFEDTEFYLLAEPRPNLVVFNRYNHMNAETGYFVDIDVAPLDIYPFYPVHDKENKIIGSCSQYHTRQEASDLIQNMSLDEVLESYGNRLVIVASQKLRIKSLWNEFSTPYYTKNDFQYYMLEKIGRSRRLGELTCGTISLNSIMKDAKTQYYNRKFLAQHLLIKKQPFCFRNHKMQNTNANLVHLARYHMEVKTRKQKIIEQIVRILKSKPGTRMDSLELKKTIGLKDWDQMLLTKLVKTPEFKTFVRSSASPYRSVYPNASSKEWRTKNHSEKYVRIFELVDPEVNIHSMWKDEETKDSSSDEESNGSDSYNELLGNEMYNVIRSCGKEGIFQKDLQKRMGLDFYTVRTLVRNLLRYKVIGSKMMDSGRQRCQKFFTTSFLNNDPAETISTTTSKNPVLKNDDDETLDFIADVLNIDSSCLKRPRAPTPEPEVEIPRTPSNYDLINQIKIRAMNKAQNVKERLEDKKTLSEICANKHEMEIGVFEDDVQMDIKVNDECFKAVVSAMFSDDESVSTGEPAEEPWELAKPNVASSKEVKVVKFSKVLKKLFNKQPSIKSRYYKSYLQVFHKIYSELQNSCGYVDKLFGDDETDCDSKDANSLNVNLEDGGLAVKQIEVKKRKLSTSAPEVEDVKKICVVPETIEVVEDKEAEEKMDIYMGSHPLLLSREVDEDNVEVTIHMANPDKIVKLEDVKIESQRVQDRFDLIVKYLKQHKLITDIYKISHYIVTEEKKQGLKELVDRRSLHRIYVKLLEAGRLKILRIKARYCNVVRHKDMFLDYSIEITNSTIASVVEQFKMSFFIYAKRKTAEGNKGKVVENKIIPYKYSRTVGRIYGSYPKISRAKVLHEFLFYLVYDYDGVKIEDVEVENVLRRHYDKVDVKLLSECSTIYQPEISWKTFVPPLPEHKDYTTGWSLICDVLLRLPLSIFVKIFQVRFVINDLPKYLNHPIKKHLLVKNLPANIRDAVLNYRMYIFSIHEVFCMLCYLGLAQFGPQKFREKDQYFIYLNRNGILYDTSSSPPGYHHIVKGEYPKKSYRFESSLDLENYWNDMYAISTSTRLGVRATVLGEEIKLESVDAKPLMLESLKPQTQESAWNNDVGYLPGDGLGACCCDSALWLHVKRNWIWSGMKKPVNAPKVFESISGQRQKHINEVKPIKFKEYLIQNPSRTTKIYKDGRVRLSKKKKKAAVAAVLKKGMPPKTSKGRTVIRKVKPRKPMKKTAKANKVDSVDKAILAKIGKTRATFCREEDDLIQICRMVTDYLCPNIRKRSVCSASVRDFIHRILPYSRATSAAYRRRAIMLTRSHDLNDKKQPIDCNLTSSYFVQKHFKKHRDRLIDLDVIVSDKELNLTFIYLAYYAYKTWQASPKQQTASDNTQVIDYLETKNLSRFNSRYTEPFEETLYQPHESEEDINLDTIKSVMHSSLACTSASKDWPFQLLKVYQTFSENSIRSALQNMRDQQIISGRKANTKHSRPRQGSILMCGTAYHLSFAYTFKQITKYPHYIFTECDNIFQEAYKNREEITTIGKSIEPMEQGHGIGISELATVRKVEYIFDFPDELISLDPNLKDHNDLVHELALRLASKLTETDDNSKNDPKLRERLESTLDTFLKSQLAGNKEIVVNIQLDEELDDIEPEYGINTDRRQKGLKISDLAFLLTKGLFPELDDDNRLESLNKHFLVRYPTCRFTVTDPNFQGYDELYDSCHAVNAKRYEEIVEEMRRIVIITNKMPTDEMLLNALKDAGGVEDDKTTLDEILSFVFSKNILGASSAELKEKFPNQGVEKLLSHLRILVSTNAILKVGITRFTFIHYNFRHLWSIYLHPKKDDSESRLECGGVRLVINPWVRIDGTIHEKVLSSWLKIVLSHCVSYPVSTMQSMCRRFCYIKPVDIFTLLEVLQSLTCIKLMIYSQNEENLFSDINSLDLEWGSVSANFLDDFDDVYIETDNLAAIKFGAFLSGELPETTD